MFAVSLLKTIIGFVVGAAASGGLAFLCIWLYMNRNPVDSNQIGGFVWMMILIFIILAVIAVAAVAGGIAGGVIIHRVWR